MPNKTRADARLLRHYSSNETLATSIHLSNLGMSNISRASLSWKVVAQEEGGRKHTVCSKSEIAIPHVASGPGSSKLMPVACNLPDLGTFQQSPKPPLSLVRHATLRKSAGTPVASNSWRSRQYAKYEAGPSPGLSAV